MVDFNEYLDFIQSFAAKRRRL